MLLNEEYSFADVRYLINRKVSYDVELSFISLPQKTLYPKGSILCRLDFPIVLGLFSRVWWMEKDVLADILKTASPGGSALRMEWQHQQAMPKASKGTRTLIIEIETTAAVYGWSGIASPLFNKAGGAQQVYLPNLSKGSGFDRSDYARLRHTYTLPAQ